MRLPWSKITAPASAGAVIALDQTPIVAILCASVNLDFTRVLFTCNWGRSGTGEVEMYLIELPQDWTEQLP
jgi:hypothetical protein